MVILWTLCVSLSVYLHVRFYNIINAETMSMSTGIVPHLLCILKTCLCHLAEMERDREREEVSGVLKRDESSFGA